MKQASLLTPEARKVWNALSRRQRAKIDKYNPFKGDRNKAIRELKARGVSNVILAEITGMTTTAVCYISHGKSWSKKKEAQTTNGSSGR